MHHKKSSTNVCKETNYDPRVLVNKKLKNLQHKRGKKCLYKLFNR